MTTRGAVARGAAVSHQALCVGLLAIMCTGCGGGGGRAPTTAPPPPAPAASLPQRLYEAGRYDEIVRSVPEDGRDAEGLWFAAHSHLRLAQRDQAQRRLLRIRDIDAPPGMRAAAGIALAELESDEAALEGARAEAQPVADDPFVQFELGLADARRQDYAAAARAFDRCAALNPRFAYAYYNAALAYDRLNRSDLAVIRLETFQRLAPEAPERPEVEALLRTVRTR